MFWERFRSNTIAFSDQNKNNNKSELYPRPQLPLDFESWTNLFSSLCTYQFTLIGMSIRSVLANMKKYKYQISQLWKWHIGIVRYEKKLIGRLHPARLTYFSVLFELKIFYNSSYSKGPQPLIILSTVFSTIPDRCRYDTYYQLSFINLRALYETQIQTYPTTSDVMEEFLDIDLGEISKSESDLYKKDSLRWGKCCSTNPGLDPSNWSRTPGPPAEPLSTSKLKLKYRIRNK